MATVEETGLLGACRNSQQSAISEWLAKGADPDVREADGHRPISLAMQGYNQDSALKILSALEKIYASSPQKLLDALTVGLPENTDLSKLATQKRWNEVSKEITRVITDAKVNLGDKDQWFSAAHKGDEPLIKRIIDTGKIDVNVKDNYGLSAIYLTAAFGYGQSVRFLLEGGADPDSRTPNNDTPLAAASTTLIEGPGLRILEALQKKYAADPKKLLESVTMVVKGTSPPQMRAKTQKLEKLSTNIENVVKDAKVALGDIDQWFEAAMIGNISLLKRIIDTKLVDINLVDKAGCTALHRATTSGYVSAIKLLLDSGADPDCRVPNNLTPFFIATDYIVHEEGGLAILKKLKEKYKNDPAKLLEAVTATVVGKESPLERAKNRHFNNLAADLEKVIEDAKVALFDVKQWFDSAWNGNTALLDKILKAGGIDVHLANEDGHTALHISALRSQMEATEFLLLNGADPDSRTPNNDTPLILSTASFSQDCGLFILSKLKQKYLTDPVRLLDAITAKRIDGNTAEKKARDNRHLALADEIHKETELVQRAIAALPLPVRVPKPPPIIPRSKTPSPIRLDRTVTAAKLLQNNGSGKSNLLTLCEQGQLGDVFTDKIWIGRREEMDEVWEQVPERFRNQVNIEVVRGHLSQATVMDKFGIVKDKEWEKGF